MRRRIVPGPQKVISLASVQEEVRLQDQIVQLAYFGCTKSQLDQLFRGYFTPYEVETALKFARRIVGNQTSKGGGRVVRIGTDICKKLPAVRRSVPLLMCDYLRLVTQDVHQVEAILATWRVHIGERDELPSTNPMKDASIKLLVGAIEGLQSGRITLATCPSCHSLVVLRSQSTCRCDTCAFIVAPPYNHPPELLQFHQMGAVGSSSAGGGKINCTYPSRRKLRSWFVDSSSNS